MPTRNEFLKLCPWLFGVVGWMVAIPAVGEASYLDDGAVMPAFLGINVTVLIGVATIPPATGSWRPAAVGLKFLLSLLLLLSTFVAIALQIDAAESDDLIELGRFAATGSGALIGLIAGLALREAAN